MTVGEFVADRLFQLFRRFMPYRPLPGGAVRFLKNLFDRARTDGLEDLAMTAVLGQFTKETGLPLSLLCDDQALDVEALHRHLNEEVIGQSAACGVVTDVIARFKTGLNDPGRPLAALLFCGPTGVGKTQLAKSTSEYLFGHGDKADRLVRLDMSEYSSPYAAERLLTGSDGSVSEFLSRVRQQPFCVVLLDEIEKASAEVYDMLLGLLDEGRLTDRFGRTTTFRNALLIMTSNLGATRGSSVGLQPQTVPSYEREVREFFRPEFFNRLDQIVVFHPLGESDCRAIIRKELDEVPRRAGCEKRGLSVQFHDTVVEYLLQIGFDPQLGARPLQRAIEESVVAALARQLADGVQRKGRKVAVTVQTDGTAVLQWD